MSRDIKNFNNGIDVDSVADRIAAGDNDALAQFFSDAAGAEFLVPFRGSPNNLAVLNSPEGEKMLPAFSSYEAFEKCPLEKKNAVIMPFSRLDKIVGESRGAIDGLVINPHGKALVCKKQPGGASPTYQKNEGPQSFRLSKPASVPEAIPAVLSGFFAGTGKVYKAYLLWAQKNAEIVPHLFLVVDFDGKPEELFPKIGEVLRPYFGKGDKIEMAKADLKLLEAAEKVTKPFYKK